MTTYKNLEAHEVLNLSQEQDPVVKANQVAELLTKGVFQVTWTKNDGTTTSRPATLAPQYVPEYWHEPTPQALLKRVGERNKGVVSFYDLTKNAWSKLNVFTLEYISSYYHE